MPRNLAILQQIFGSASAPQEDLYDSTGVPLPRMDGQYVNPGLASAQGAELARVERETLNRPGARFGSDGLTGRRPSVRGPIGAQLATPPLSSTGQMPVNNYTELVIAAPPRSHAFREPTATPSPFPPHHGGTPYPVDPVGRLIEEQMRQRRRNGGHTSRPSPASSTETSTAREAQPSVTPTRRGRRRRPNLHRLSKQDLMPITQAPASIPIDPEAVVTLSREPANTGVGASRNRRRR